MAFKQKTRLFNVHLENCILSGIEATDVKDALKHVEKDLENFKDKTLTSVDSEPIYKASLGLEIDMEDVSGTGLFDVTVAGTNETLVNKLRDALAMAIGGMGPEFTGLSDGTPDNGKALSKFIGDTGLNITAM